MTPEERKIVKDSIPEASIVDARKENIEPRREGRSMSSLARTLLMDTVERERTIVEGKARFEEKLDKLEDLDDPLQVFLDQITWTIEMFPEGSIEDDLMILLHDATSRYKSKKLYRQDPRYLKLWTEYAHWVEKPEEIFILLFQHGIGTELALLYEEYASLLETLERYDDAFRVYELGIESEAHPVRRLVRSYEESKKSLAERQRQGLLKQKEEDEARRRMYEMRANNRTLLGEKTDARSKTSFSANVFPNVQSNLGLPSRSSSTSFGNDRSSIPATSNSSSSASTSKISVYQDAESSSSSSSTSSRRTLSTLSQRNSASQKSASQFKRTGSLSSQFENRISAEKFEDVTIPQAETRYQTPTDSFKVHVDSKEQEPVRGLERNNSSLLSETSGEESRVSRLRKHPIEELEGTYVKRSRVDNRSETDIKHAKRMEDHFKRQRMLYLVNRDSKDREEVITVLKTTHSGTSFEEERAIALGIPYKEKPKDEEEEEEALSGFAHHYKMNKVTVPDVGFTTETRLAVGSMKKLLYSDDINEEEEKDLTWTNPIQHLNLPKYTTRRKYGSDD